AEKRVALERVLNSATFHRSGQLRSLLKYVCEREIEGTGETLSEYAVAVGALHRSADYSSLEDGSVRNRFHTLRRRLEHYYAIENPADALRIELPKGSYCPCFSKQPIVELTSTRSWRHTLPRRALLTVTFWNNEIKLRTAVALGAALLVLAIGVTAWVFRTPPRYTDPILAEAWGPLLSPGGKPLICLATAAQLTLIQRP